MKYAASTLSIQDIIEAKKAMDAEDYRPAIPAAVCDRCNLETSHWCWFENLKTCRDCFLNLWKDED